MANYLCVFPASDAHIDFIAENPDALYALVDGKRPSIAETPTAKPTLWQRLTGNVPRPQPPAEIPEDWPSTEATMIGPEINHRNVDLFHLILNGTTDYVTGPGSIFQTWLQTRSNRTHSAIDLGGYNEDFAFHSDQLPALLELIERVNEESILSSFTTWLQANGDDYTPSREGCIEIANEFSHFEKGTRSAIDKSQGLIWISS